MRVLIVDDSRTARLMLKKMLPPQLLVDLIEVSGGREAISRCAYEQVDVMFLDLTMPECDGYQVLQSLRLRDRMPPTVVVSVDAQAQAQQRVLALGARAFLKKMPARDDIERVLKAAGIL